MTVHVELLCSGSSEHLSQVFTGFAMLRAQGECTVEVKRWSTYEGGLGGAEDTSLLRIVSGGRQIVYDVLDGATLVPEALDWADVYVKRSYSPVEHGADPKVRPFGLNFPAYGPRDWRTRRLVWSVLGLRRDNAANIANHARRLNRWAAWATRAKNGCRASDLAGIEHGPEADRPPKVMFCTRLWDPARVSGTKRDEWTEMNRLRIECLRNLRTALGPGLVGGLAPTPLAVERHPDLVLDEDTMLKTRYLGRMHRTAIGVATAGLRGSNGWSLGEYLAASRAIVTERLRYEIGHPFAPGANHLPFDTAEGCVDQAVALVEDPDRTWAMMRANQELYRLAARPDRLIGRSLGLWD